MFGLASVVLWTVVVLPFTYCLYNFIHFYLDVRKRAKHIHKFPGDPPHPLWGHIHEFPGPNEAGLKYLVNSAIKYSRVEKAWYGPFLPTISVYHPETAGSFLKTSGPDERGLIYLREKADSTPEGMAKVWFGPFVPTVNVYHPETVKVLLKTSEPKPGKFGGYRLLSPWLGDGLLVSKGHKWARNRRLLTPAFHFDILKPYMAVYNHSVDVFLDKLEQFSIKNENFEVFSHVSLLTLDVMLRCAFSYDNDCQLRGDSHPYVKAVNDMQETVVARLLRPWLYPDVIFYLTPGGRQFKKDCDYVHSVSEEIMAKRRKTLATEGETAMSKSRYLDFLDILLTARDDDGRGLLDIEIRDEVDTFLFEGHDTTASGVSWTLYSLAQNPEAQRKCQQEVDELLAGRDSDDILWEDLANLKYTTLCIKEALRLHTPVPFIERQTTKDMQIEGYFLPAGTVVDIQLYVLHHNPLIWGEDHMEYVPERMSQENMQKKDSFAFVPFSAGPRNCIGQHFAMHEMKTIIARIMRRFTLSLHKEKPVNHRIVVVMKTEQGMYMKAEKRRPSEK